MANTIDWVEICTGDIERAAFPESAATMTVHFRETLKQGSY